MENGYLYIEENIVPTLLAISEQEQSLGLMHQPWPPPIMSFIYASPRISKFWMKNTPSPLDIIFCCEGKVVEICKGEPHSTATIGGADLSDLVVELPYGMAKEMNIQIGSEIGLVKPTRSELKKICEKKYNLFYKI